LMSWNAEHPTVDVTSAGESLVFTLTEEHPSQSHNPDFAKPLGHVEAADAHEIRSRAVLR
jgi:hypothetical protein